MTRAPEGRSNWTRARILYELKERGIPAAALAASNGLSRSTLYAAIERPYPRVQSLIAQALERNLQDIWPLFYGDNGRRLTRREQFERARQSSRSAA